MKKKALEQFEDLKKDIELLARMAKRMQPEAEGEALKKIILDEIALEPQIQSDMEAFTAEHLIDIKIKVNDNNEVQLDTIDLSKNKLKLQIRGNGTERVINATINDVPVLVKVQKDGKFKFTNEDAIEALEELVAILKTNKVSSVADIQEDITISGKEIAQFFENDEPVQPESYKEVEDAEDAEDTSESLEDSIDSDPEPNPDFQGEAPEGV